jgi:hypothetical protein
LTVPVIAWPVGADLDRVIVRTSGAPRYSVSPILQVLLSILPGASLDHAGDLSGMQMAILIA